MQRRTGLSLFAFFLSFAFFDAACAVDNEPMDAESSALAAGNDPVDLEALEEADDPGGPEAIPEGEDEREVQGAVADTSATARAKAALGKGTWAFTFVVDGATIGTWNSSRRLYGASTFKLFTGWTSFKAKSASTTLLDHMLSRSDNEEANQVMCRNGEVLGRWNADCVARLRATPAMKIPGAIDASLKYLRSRGTALSPTFRMRDGSGYDPGNVLTAADLHALLARIHGDPEGRAFRRLLAQPGKASTLGSRFPSLRGRMFAKTGTYVRTGAGVKALAGFVDLKNGKTLIFSVVGNGVGAPNAAMSRIESAVRIMVDEAEKRARGSG